MSDILASVRPDEFLDFTRLFTPAEGRMGVAVSFIAILELKREGLIEIVQNEAYAPIYISGVGPEGAARVIEGSAAEVVDADARLLSDSIPLEDEHEAGEDE